MNIKDYKMNNKGLTLVELMVAIAISTLVIAAIWQFMLISTRTYQGQKTTTDLQQEVQQTMNQAENIIIDTNRAINYVTGEADEEKILEVYSSNKVSKLIWNPDDYTLMYSETSVVQGEIKNDTEIALLAKGVKEFDVDVSKVESDKILKLRMVFERNDKTYEATRNITLRNMVAKNGNISDIYLNDKPSAAPSASVVFADPIPTELVPGKTYTFNATVSNAANPKLLWTVLGKTSNNTEIDVETGKLTVSIDEGKDVENHEITIVVTLESNRNVFASRTIKVTDAPDAAITIDTFPEWVLYGGIYDIGATVEPDMYEDHLIWTIVGQGTTVNGKIENEKLYVTSTSLNTIEVQASVAVNNTVTVYESATVPVRHPEFEVLVNGSKTYSNLVRGNVIEIDADWSKSYSGKTVNYVGGTLDGEEILWSYLVGNADVNDEDNWTTIVADANGDYKIELPYKLDIGKVIVKGVASNGVTCTQELTLATPSLSVEAYDGTTLINGTLVPIGKAVTLKPVLSGMNSAKASYVWDVRTTDGMVVTPQPVVGTKDVVFTLNNTYVGKTLVVTLKEREAKVGERELVGTINLAVATVQVCSGEQNTTLPVNSRKYNYLHANASGATQNPFFIPIENAQSTSYTVTTYTSLGTVTQGSYADVLKVDKKDDGYLCTPVHSNFNYGYSNIQKVIIHVDDSRTGEHITRYELKPAVTNLGPLNNLYYYIPYTISDINSNGKTYEKTYSFDNFYGEVKNAAAWNTTPYPQVKEYTVQYSTRTSWGTKYQTITIKNGNTTYYDKSYYWSDWYDRWRESY